MKRSYLIIALLLLLVAIASACTSDPDQPSQTGAPSQPSASDSSQSALSSSDTSPSVTTPPVTTAPITSGSVTTVPVTTPPVTTPSVTTPPITTPPVTTPPVTTPPVTTVPVTTTEPITQRPSTLVTPEVEPDNDELVNIGEYIPSLYVDLRYASENNLAGMPIYSYTDAYLRYGTVKRLAAVQEDLLEEGYSLLVWDAYRPLSAQLTLSQVLPEKGTSPTVNTVAYNNGDTLSLSIVKADGSSIPIPYDFDYSDRPSAHDNTRTAKANAQRLADAMYAHGFKDYLSQWYRFTDKDAYEVDEALTIGKDGIESCPEWVTVCDNLLSLRSRPDYDAREIAKLPRGKKVKLIFFESTFAYVEVDGKLGYIHAAYLARSLDGQYQADLEVVEPRKNYSYEQMQSDLAELAAAFPDLLRLSSIGQSENGRELTLAILGNENAPKKVFLQSTIHAREYIVTEVTMAQIDYMLHHQSEVLPNSELTIGELLEQVCFHIVPMSNPDGVEIVQTGIIPDALADRVSADKALLWKANGKGVDLNANFDADWEDYGNSVPYPNYMGYQGTAPESAAESKALADYLRANDFDLILSYHTSGSIIYWSYGGDACKAVNDLNYDLSCRLAILSGYTINQQASSSTAGLKDWAIQTLRTPSLTIEFAAGTAPAMIREFDQIWVRTRDMLALCGEWVLDR